MEISRWRSPPDPYRNETRPGGDAGVTDFTAPAGADSGGWAVSGGWHHRLISNDPSGLVSRHHPLKTERNRKHESSPLLIVPQSVCAGAISPRQPFPR